MTRHHNTGENNTVIIVSKFFQNEAKLKYFGTTVTNQNCLHEEMKSRVNSGNIFYN
jgi:hypothetical protein